MNLMKNNNTFLTMESLALPEELLWNGKEEPTSPPSTELFPITDDAPHGDWLTDDDLENGIKLLEGESFELKPGIDFSHELINGDDLVVELIDLKEENWSETKLHPSSPHHVATQIIPLGLLVSSTNSLGKIVNNEFDLNTTGLLYNGGNIVSVENAILTQLTPPHSPPRNSNAISPEFSSQIEENINNHVNAIQSHQHQALSRSVVITSGNNTPSAPASASVHQSNNNCFNIDLATQIVDDIVNTRAREIFTWNEVELESQSSCSSPSLADSSASNTDEEWMPSSSSDSSFEGLLEAAAADDQDSASAAGLVGKKRKRPYGRAVEDRKIRKKEQNKNAATRYRQKKKLEMEVVLNEEQQLTQRNNELQRMLAERNREAKYLKSLLREFHEKRKRCDPPAAV